MKDCNGKAIEAGDYMVMGSGNVVYELVCINNSSITLKGLKLGNSFTTRIPSSKFRILEPEELI